MERLPSEWLRANENRRQKALCAQSIILSSSAPETRKYQLENQITEASVLNKAALEAGFAQLADAMVHRIIASEVSREAKEDLLRDLAGIPIVLEYVAARQSKLPR
jgi:hypothetical protein